MLAPTAEDTGEALTIEAVRVPSINAAWRAKVESH